MEPSNGADDTVDEEPSNYPGTPRWVMLIGAAAVVFVVAVLARHLAGGGMAGHAH